MERIIRGNRKARLVGEAAVICQSERLVIPDAQQINPLNRASSVRSAELDAALSVAVLTVEFPTDLCTGYRIGFAVVGYVTDPACHEILGEAGGELGLLFLRRLAGVAGVV